MCSSNYVSSSSDLLKRNKAKNFPFWIQNGIFDKEFLVSFQGHDFHNKTLLYSHDPSLLVLQTPGNKESWIVVIPRIMEIQHFIENLRRIALKNTWIYKTQHS